MDLVNNCGHGRIPGTFGFINISYLADIGCMYQVCLHNLYVLYYEFTAENEYDQAGDEEWLEVEVVDPLFDMMGIEVSMHYNYTS